MSKANPHTHGILDAYADYTGSNQIYQVGRFTGAARNLANYGLLPDHLVPLLQWIKDTTGMKGVDIVTAQKAYYLWVDAGRPGAPQETRSIEDQINAIRHSNDPRYDGSAGARARAQDIEAVHATR